VKLDLDILKSCKDLNIGLAELTFLYGSLIEDPAWIELSKDCNYQLLQYHGFLDPQKKISEHGKIYLLTLLTDTTPKEESSEFKEFWQTFPSSDKWGPYPKTRVLKVSKEECKELFESLCKVYSPDVILQTLKYEILQRKKKGNGLKYMKSSVNWLKETNFDLNTDEYTGDVL
jgi:hypothetical protein